MKTSAVTERVRFPKVSPLRRRELSDNPPPLAPREAEHRVQYYDDDGLLFDAVLRFLRVALQRGDPAVAIATREHLRGLELRLRAEGGAVAHAIEAGALVLYDAESMLSEFMVGDLPDPLLFSRTLGDLLDQQSLAPHGRVRVFGEMVDLLWRAGNLAGVVRLEELWREQLAVLPIDLLCGYRADAFAKDEHSPAFRRICELHSQVAPCHDILGETDLGRMRALAHLEQRASALQAEVERRRDLEAIRERLFRLCVAVNRAVNLDEVYDPALDAVCDLLHVQRAALLLCDAQGVLRFEAWRHLSGPSRAVLERHLACASGAEPALKFVHDVLASPELASCASLLACDRVGALGLIPLCQHDEPLGALMIFGESLPKSIEHETQLASELAQHVAEAVVRTRLFERERAARERAESAQRRGAFLLEAGALLAASLDFEAALERVAKLAVSRIADWCAISIEADVSGAPCSPILAHADPLKLALASSVLERYPSALADFIDALALEAGDAPVLVQDIPDAMLMKTARDEGHLCTLRSLRLRSGMIIPMTARGKRFGTITLSTAESHRRFEAEDLALAKLLGVRAGIAIDNALLYRSARAASAAREHVLAVVSHDLRNPLGAIVVSAGNLLRLDRVPSHACVVRSAELVKQAAERMSRLISDLVDFAGMQGGCFTIEYAVCEPAAIVAEAFENVTGLLAGRKIQLVTQPRHASHELSCDRGRIIQALANLLSNAVKATPDGGIVVLGSEQRGSEMVFFVRDDGPGLAADELPLVFERYWRSIHSTYPGSGLGLSIAKGVIEAHRGRIWAESTPGQGSCFSFALPLSATSRS
jgi:signal transduction histidine kinase